MAGTAKPHFKEIFPPHPRPASDKQPAVPRPLRLRDYYPSAEDQTWFDEWERMNRKPTHLEKVSFLNIIQQLADRSPAQAQISLL
jgi:hypothetical protein